MKHIPDGNVKRFNDMSRTITYDSQGKDITCMKIFDALKYPCNECDREDCEEREEHAEIKSKNKYNLKPKDT